RRDRLARRDRRFQQLAGGHQHAFVFAQPREQPVPARTEAASGAQLVRRRQRLAMALHLVRAVELRAQRGLLGIGPAAQRCDHVQGFANSSRDFVRFPYEATASAMAPSRKRSRERNSSTVTGAQRSVASSLMDWEMSA